MSDKTKRTPGPWRAWNPIQEGWAVSEVLPGRPAISMGHRVADEIDREDDARLIAAAPDLLAALRELMAPESDLHLKSNVPSDVLLRAHAAIAKAEGKS